MVDFKVDTTKYEINVISGYDCCWTRLNVAIIEIFNDVDQAIWSKQVDEEFVRLICLKED